jgi:hypothetical protein
MILVYNIRLRQLHRDYVMDCRVLSPLSRLELLKAHEEMWRTFSWSEHLALDLPYSPIAPCVSGGNPRTACLSWENGSQIVRGAVYPVAIAWCARTESPALQISLSGPSSLMRHKTCWQSCGLMMQRGQ